MKSPFFRTVVAIAVTLIINLVAKAQDQTTATIQCGDIIEAETTPNEAIQSFIIEARAGTTLNGRVEPIGSTFNVYIEFADSGGGVFGTFNSKTVGLAEEFSDFIISSSNPVLVVAGELPDSTYLFHTARYGQFFGAYTIYLGCTLRDGTVINPGDTAQPPTQQPLQPTTVPTLAPDFTGFPGLAPVDFANAFRLPLTLGTASVGEIPTGGDAVLGFKFSANEGDKLDLSFTRTSGNLNLGLVVLSADNKVAYMAALVSSETMSTAFTLPSSGEYTIGIFRIDLIPPATPEATGFEILVQPG